MKVKTMFLTDAEHTKIRRYVRGIDPVELQVIGWNAHKFAEFQHTVNVVNGDNADDAMHHIDSTVDIDTITRNAGIDVDESIETLNWEMV